MTFVCESKYNVDRILKITTQCTLQFNTPILVRDQINGLCWEDYEYK